jgi:copper transporter 1
MVPWLHFSGGDNLLFQSWHPTSKGAIAGASIGLLFLALFERWLAAMRVVLEARWRRKYDGPYLETAHH